MKSIIYEYFFVLSAVPPLSHVWAVDVMNSKTFKKQFDEYAKKTLPVIARVKYSVSSFDWPYDKKSLLEGNDKEKNRKIVEKFMKTNKYNVVWQNEYFEILDN